jgi:hypothetical protein
LYFRTANCGNQKGPGLREKPPATAQWASDRVPQPSALGSRQAMPQLAGFPPDGSVSIGSLRRDVGAVR